MPDSISIDSDSAVELALDLLHQIAEDPIMRGSYREAARRHLVKLERAAEREESGEQWREAIGSRRRTR